MASATGHSSSRAGAGSCSATSSGTRSTRCPPSGTATTSLCIDAWHTVVRVEHQGDPIEVDRRDIRPPDFEVTPAHRFWEPPDDADLPCVVDTFEGHDLYSDEGAPTP